MASNEPGRLPNTSRRSNFFGGFGSGFTAPRKVSVQNKENHSIRSRLPNDLMAQHISICLILPMLAIG
jgi:hypothetical protein